VLTALRGARGVTLMPHHATVALTLAPHRAFADRSLLLEGDAQVLALLAARPTADPGRVTEAVLGAVTGPGSEHLIEGLDAYLQTGSAAEGAATLHLHP